MDPIGLKVNPATQFDPIGSMQKGIQLGQMGLNVDLLQQQLRTQAIAEQEATRALDMKRYEDSARRSLASIMSKHTTKDAAGKGSTNLRAALAEAREQKLDPSYTTELEGRLYANEAGALNNSQSRVEYIKKTLDELSPTIRYMQEGPAARFVESRAKLLARATGMPIEEIGPVVADHFNLGSGGKLVESARMFADAQIPVAAERSLTGQGLGREDLSPTGDTSKQARAFLQQQGINAPASMSLPQLRQHPLYGPKIREWEQRVTSTIPTEGTRVGAIEAATDASTKRQLINDALAFRQELKQVVGTKIGSKAQEAINSWILQDPKRALLQSAVDAYNQDTGAKLDIGEVGIDAAFARLSAHERQLRNKQDSAASLGGTGNLQTLAPEKSSRGVPAADMRSAGKPGEKQSLAQPGDSDQATIMRQEYDRAVKLLNAPLPEDATSPEKKAAALARREKDVDEVARELRKQGITVPGSSDVKRDAKKTTEMVRVRNKESGKTYTMPPDFARRALASNKFERVE